MAEIVKMENPESVRTVGRMLGRLAGKILDAQTEISRAAHGMDWDGSGKGDFLQNVEIWAGKMYECFQGCTEKGSVVMKEAEEWEIAAKEFGWGAEGYTPFLLGDKDGTAAIDKSDIRQGGELGDCYLLSSLGSIAQQHPEVIEDMIEVLPDGRCRVRFYDKHCQPPFGPCTYVEHWVTIDMDFLPGPHSSPTDVTAGGTEAWAMIVEKAYLQWQKENNQLIDLPSPAVALSAITGKDTTTLPNQILTMEDLNKSFQRGDAMTVAAWWDLAPRKDGEILFDLPDPSDVLPEYQDPNSGIHTDHVYFITNVDPASNTVTLQNPWGPEYDPIKVDFAKFQELFPITMTNPIV